MKGRPIMSKVLDALRPFARDHVFFENYDPNELSHHEQIHIRPSDCRRAHEAYWELKRRLDAREREKEAQPTAEKARA